MKKTIAINSAKLSKRLINVLNLGSGSQVPGRVALQMHPNILEDFASELSDESIKINITGTNGKTTTTGFVKSIINRPIICNDMGANLHPGVVAAFVENAYSGLDSKLKTRDYLLEVDEASLGKISSALDPKIITVTNLYRDQLDRFGELDTTQKLINKGIGSASNPILVLNADHPHVACLGQEIEKDYKKSFKKVFYNVKFESKKEDTIKNLESTLISSAQTYKPEKVDIQGIVLDDSDPSKTKIKLLCGTEETKITVPLPGIYNVYNAVAAAATAYTSGFTLEQIKEGIENYQTNFGRSEEKTYNDIKTHTFLIKNPAGATEVLKQISSSLSKEVDSGLLVIINDNYADGRDISWLWDAEFEHLKNYTGKIYVSGHRANDMAVRLKYAGIDKEQIFVIQDIQTALDMSSLELIGESAKLYILPTYTALLELEKITK